MVSDDGRYEILSELGRGGFGIVYHARFLGEGGFTKEVALKMLAPDMETVAEVSSRFRDEARMLGLLKHRAIVGVDSLTKVNGSHAIVMEYVEGWNLDHLLAYGPFPTAVALRITAEIASALYAAYTRRSPQGQQLRLLHRDLKPSNIRMTPDGDIKLLDFGIARANFAQREAQTRSMAFGSPDYMAPERLAAAADTPAADVYALGAVLFEMLTGAQLGLTSPKPERHARNLEEAVVLLAADSVQPAVRDLVLQLLHFDQEVRPSAAEVERRANALVMSTDGLSLREWAGRFEVPPKTADLAEAHEGFDAVVPGISSSGPVPPDPTLWQPALISGPSGRQASFPPRPLRVARTAMTQKSDSQETEHAGAARIAKPDHETGRSSSLGLVSQPEPARSRVSFWLVAILGMMTAGGVGLWALLRREPVVATPSVAETPALRIDPEEPAASAQSSQAPEAPSPAATPASAPMPAAGTSRAHAISDRVQVALTGDATRAVVVSGKARFSLPGNIPTGSYVIYATFEGEAEAAAGAVTVVSGRTLNIHCDSQFGRCAAKESTP